MIKKLALGAAALLLAGAAIAQQPKIYIAFQWHMHQPIYTPGQTLIETQNTHEFSFDLIDTHTSRTGAYTSWPADAVQKLIDAGLPGGAQVSFSGTLIDNLNNLESNGKGFSGWKQNWIKATSNKTSLGNKRLDMVGFGYYHPLMALIDQEDVAEQVKRHKEQFAANFPGMTYSNGLFPPECAFQDHMIKPLVEQGIKWVMVDNAHFDRACQGLPYYKAFSMVEPNGADVINPNPGDWGRVNNLYCPGEISKAWGHRPHWIQYVDPESGQVYKMIAVPASLVFGNEDGRGGFGALNYAECLGQLASANTDPNHPTLVLMHHDGDNHGGGSESYYHGNFDQLVNWVKGNSDKYEIITIDDYLQRFPPDDDDIIHVESGSWWGAGADPEFLKWNGDEEDGYSPDHNSWGVMTAAANYVRTAVKAAPSDPDVKKAHEYLLMGQTSCYWYWDGTENWDSKTAVASNLAINLVKGKVSNDQTGPSIYHPQREPYNPGATEWEKQMPSDFTVWTYVYDLSGLSSVKLKYRVDKDGKNPINSIQNETYAGGDEVGEWQEIEMTPKTIASIQNPQPLFKADEYSAKITGLKDVLVDYYVEATDTKGNVAKSIILHVYVGKKGVEPPVPDKPTVTANPGSRKFNESVTVTLSSNPSGLQIHYTTDGSTPSASSPVYSSPLTFTQTTTLKTFVEKDDQTNVQTFTYTYSSDPLPQNAYVYFDNAGSNWSAPTVWAWNAASNVNCCKNGTWPGDAMTLKDGVWYWEAPDGKVPDSIIFSDNGSSQTSDLKFKNGATYKSDGSYIGGGDDPIIIPGTDWTIYFDNSVTNYSPVKVHHFDVNASTWPGIDMTLVEGNIYKATIPADTRGLVFNNGSGAQTADVLNIQDKHLYKADSADGKPSVSDMGLYYETFIGSVASDNDALRVETGEGCLIIRAASAAHINVTDLTGRTRILSVYPGENRFDTPSGFYVVAGRKYFVK